MIGGGQRGVREVVIGTEFMLNLIGDQEVQREQRRLTGLQDVSSGLRQGQIGGPFPNGSS